MKVFSNKAQENIGLPCRPHLLIPQLEKKSVDGQSLFTDGTRWKMVLRSEKYATHKVEVKTAESADGRWLAVLQPSGYKSEFAELARFDQKIIWLFDQLNTNDPYPFAVATYTEQLLVDDEIRARYRQSEVLRQMAEQSGISSKETKKVRSLERKKKNKKRTAFAA